MKEIIDAMKANLKELSNDDSDAETRSFLAKAQAKLAEAFVQSLQADKWKCSNPEAEVIWRYVNGKKDAVSINGVIYRKADE